MNGHGNNQAFSPRMRQSNPADLLDEVFSPVETALASLDDVVHLLVALGAEINVATRVARNRYTAEENRLSFFDWVRRSIERVDSQIVEARKEESPEEESIPAAGWQGYSARQRLAIKTVRAKREPSDPAKKEEVIDQLCRCKDYLKDVEQMLVSRRAKTWKEISTTGEAPTPEKKSTASASVVTAPTPERLQYYSFTTAYSSNRAPKTADALYDELYEACFSGDNDKIRRFCLPPPGSKSKTQPLQISVRAATESRAWHHNTGNSCARHSHCPQRVHLCCPVPRRLDSSSRCHCQPPLGDSSTHLGYC